MKREGRVTPAPRNSSASTVALLRDGIARLIAAGEAIEDGDCSLAEWIVGDLVDDLLTQVERLVRGVSP